MAIWCVDTTRLLTQRKQPELRPGEAQKPRARVTAPINIQKKCRTDDQHDGVWRLLPRRAGALKGRALLRQSGGGMSVSESHWSRDDKRLRPRPSRM